LQKSCTPQNWDVIEIAILSKRTHVILNKKMMLLQTTQKMGQFKNKWWISSTTLPQPAKHNRESLRKHPCASRLYFVGNLSLTNHQAKVETFNDKMLFQIRSRCLSWRQMSQKMISTTYWITSLRFICLGLISPLTLLILQLCCLHTYFLTEFNLCDLVVFL
jgi:hypothetical protein